MESATISLDSLSESRYPFPVRSCYLTAGFCALGMFCFLDKGIPIAESIQEYDFGPPVRTLTNLTDLACCLCIFSQSDV